VKIIRSAPELFPCSDGEKKEMKEKFDRMHKKNKGTWQNDQ